MQKETIISTGQVWMKPWVHYYSWWGWRRTEARSARKSTPNKLLAQFNTPLLFAIEEPDCSAFYKTGFGVKVIRNTGGQVLGGILSMCPSRTLQLLTVVHIQSHNIFIPSIYLTRVFFNTRSGLQLTPYSCWCTRLILFRSKSLPRNVEVNQRSN